MTRLNPEGVTLPSVVHRIGRGSKANNKVSRLRSDTAETDEEIAIEEPPRKAASWSLPEARCHKNATIKTFHSFGVRLDKTPNNRSAT